MKPIVAILSAGLLALAVTGCATSKDKPASQRGWIGGEYVLAKPNCCWTHMSNPAGVSATLPCSLLATQWTAIQITGLTSNTPAMAAGLQTGDFVLEVNHQKMTSLSRFRHAIDHSEPGSVVTVKAYRDGQIAEYQVPVGREKYRGGGYFTITMPTVVHGWDLWPNPGFSAICVGYEPNPGLRKELGNHPKPGETVYDEGWQAYLVFMEVSHGKRIIAQESVPAAK